MAFFQAYFDESGKHTNPKEKVVTFCGFLNPPDKWGAFEDEWRYWLRKRGLQELHISSADMKANAKKLQEYRPFIHVIRKHIECGFGCGIDVAGFVAMHHAVKREFRDDPHFMVFQVAMRDVIKYVQLQPEPSFSIICDDDSEKACNIYKHWDLMRQNVKQPETVKP